MNTPTLYISPGIKLYKSFCLQFKALFTKVTPQEVFFMTVGANHHQQQREPDPEFVALEDLLVGEEWDWLTMDDGVLQLKRQTRGLTDNPLFNDNETVNTSNESYMN